MIGRRYAGRIFAAFLALGAALGGEAQAQQRVVVGFPAPWNVQFALFTYGEQLGFFREEGMTLERVAVTGSAVLLPQVANGQVHFGYANPDLTIIALSRNEPMPLRFVVNWLRSQTFEFVTLESGPVRTLADLRGRKMGVGALTWGNLPLSRAMLANAGVTWQRDVEILPVGLGTAAWRRLQTGEVDVLNLFVGEHERMAIAGVPFRRVPMPDQFRHIFSNGFAAGDTLIAQQPQLVAGFGRALVKSWLACKENREACVRSWWAANPAARPQAGQEAQQLQTELRLVTVDRNQIDDFAPGDPQQYGHFPEAAWRRLVDVMRAEGQIQRSDLDLARLYTGQFVAEFNRFDRDAVLAAARRGN
jgi:NitT/TauT family transport system substrate-binding protein